MRVCVPELDEEGMCLWNEDPVHPTPEGYSKIVDMILSEAERMRGKAGSKKRSGSILEAASKRPRQEVPRPNWVSETCAATSRQDGARRGGDRERPPFRGRGRGWVRGPGEARGRGRGQSYEPMSMGKGEDVVSTTDPEIPLPTISCPNSKAALFCCIFFSKKLRVCVPFDSYIFNVF